MKDSTKSKAKYIAMGAGLLGTGIVGRKVHLGAKATARAAAKTERVADKVLDKMDQSVAQKVYGELKRSGIYMKNKWEAWRKLPNIN